MSQNPIETTGKGETEISENHEVETPYDYKTKASGETLVSKTEQI